MRLGDLDALLEKVQFRLPATNTIFELANKFVEISRRLISEEPTIDPEELRPKGRWVRVDHYPPYCSNCEGIAPKDCEGEEFYDSDYCPNCGAKMEGTA